ncbi:hypothetical protein [Paractinoplanes toevensis]|uniref:Uncharacterized protein n=1 Tax=Paractinoplanes toevensis TaxID=571911 RepID=A0A919WBZ5_9ACTN|nr:hypothetical protein [Actinoplanes toevensis]GIM97370.1 hypothetical protein Ato02nite_091630 [Actinoplanes toevensis]
MPLPFDWDALTTVPSDEDGQRVISAARNDLEKAATALREKFDVALPFRLLSRDFKNPDEPRVVVLVGEKLRCEFTDGALQNARRKGLGPIDLIASAVVYEQSADVDGKPCVILDGNWRPKRVGRANGPTEAQMRRHRRVARLPMVTGDIERAIKAGKNVMIVGKHGSGRTALAAVVAQVLGGQGYGQIWLDLTDPADGPESVVAELLKLPKQEHYLLVADGLQANIPVVDPLLSCAPLLQMMFGLQILILATTWKSVADKVTGGDPHFDASPIGVSAEKLIKQMLDDESIFGEDRQKIETLAGDDVHIALSAIDIFHAHGRVPDVGELQQEFTRDTDAPAERRALYHLSCLGVLGLVMSEVQAVEMFGRPTITELLDRDLVHRTDEAFTVATQRRAVLVMNFALEHWPEIGSEGQPEDVVWTHLQRSDRLIRATLSQIDNVVSPETLRPASSYLISAWDISEQLARWLEKQTNHGPAWEDNLGSSVFAAMALARLDRPEQWLKIAEHVRARWTYADPELQLPEPVGGNTTDFKDFQQIGREMAEEDLAYGEDGHPSGMPAAQFDPQEAYRTWALGLLLCFEATAPLAYRDAERIRMLLDMTKIAADSLDGYFYPVRVPWVTARVLMGICHADTEPRENRVVARASKWLIDLASGSDPGQVVGRWLSGTGTWNTNEEATAMCVIALVSAQQRYRAGDVIDAALSWLTGRSAEWGREGQEIDLAQVIEAFAFCTESYVPGEQTEMLVNQHLSTLLQRTRNELRKAPVADRPEERLRLPFLAAQLTEIVWRTVQSQFKRLLRDVMGTSDRPQASSNGRSAMPRPRPEPDPAFLPEPDKGLTAGQLRVWQAAASQLRRTLNDLISDRSSPGKAGVALVQTLLAENYRQQRLYNELLGMLDSQATVETLRALDELGQEVCGPSWPTLPYPDHYRDEAPA